ncbi:MAG: protein kinase [Saprospiraceae bacterium]|nr:protein kinase [Saprospiraceae bacterium]
MKFSESTQSLPDRVALNSHDEIQLKSGRYTIDNGIGQGGYGTVYKVVREDSQIFALKILRLWDVLPNEYGFLIKRFQGEFQVGQLESPYLIKSYYQGYINGNPYLITEYCDQGNLENHLDIFDEPDSTKAFCINILSGLNTMHANAIIHRDIKPSNILFNTDLVPKLVDFGISGFLNNRLTQINIFGKIKSLDKNGLGITRGFSPPEMFNGSTFYRNTGPTMDIYSFASTVFYGITKGKFAFGEFKNEKEFNTQFLSNQKNNKLSLELLPEAYQTDRWIQFFKRNLASNPEKRFQNAIDIIKALEMNGKSDGENSSDSLGPVLSVIKNDQILQVFNLEEMVARNKKNLVTIGRQNTGGIVNDISIAEEGSYYMSKRHATIEKSGNDWVIRDGQFSPAEPGYWTYSLNGIYINDQKLEKGDYKILDQQDEIKLGSIILKFNRDEMNGKA